MELKDYWRDNDEEKSTKRRRLLNKIQNKSQETAQLVSGNVFTFGNRDLNRTAGRLAADGSVVHTVSLSPAYRTKRLRELLNDNTNFEPKVVLALSRLAKLSKPGKFMGTSCKQIIQYLNARYCNLDGDVESQVKTALLSCVKNGIVCTLDNGKYLLTGPGSKGMISMCFTRNSHGPKCSCLTTLKRLSRSSQNNCCVLKISGSSPKKGSKTPTKSKPPSRGSKRRPGGKTKPRKCAQRARKVLEDRDKMAIQMAEEASPKCNYCLEIHTTRRVTSQKLCDTCNPGGTGNVVPFDKFSPREENT